MNDIEEGGGEPPWGPMVAERDDAELLTRIVRRESEAFDELYLRHVRTVYRVALARVGTVPDAEEVTQEVFVTLWRRAATIDLAGDSLLPWLITTARFVAANRMRLASVTRAADGEHDFDAQPGAEEGPEAAAERSALTEAIASAVAELSETDQQIYRLCIEDELSYADAAQRLGLSHGAVRNRLSRVRGSLRKSLNDYERGGRA